METNIYATPQAELAPEQAETANQLATLKQRFLAAFVDTVLSMLIQIPLMFIILGEDKVTGQNPMSTAETLSVLLMGAIIYLILHGNVLVKYGQTLGKYLVKIRIVTLAGEQAKVAPHLSLRIGFTWVISSIPIYGPAITTLSTLTIFGKSRRCVHDYVARTKVVQC